MSCLDDGKRKTKRGWSPGDSLNLVRVLSVRVNYSQQCRNDINGRWEYSKSINVIFYLVLLIAIYRSSHDNILWWMPQDLTDDMSTLVQVMAWCRQAPSHYLSQCCLSSLSPYGVARPQWVNPQPEPVLTWLQQARAYSAPPAVSRSSMSKLSRINKWNVICQENIASLNYSISRKKICTSLFVVLYSSVTMLWVFSGFIYRQTSNSNHTIVGNKIVDHSDVVGAAPVVSAPTTSSFST